MYVEMPLRTKYGAQPSRPSGVDSRHAAVCEDPCTMITGGMLAFFVAGIWNDTYICPIVIWFGVSVCVAGGTVAYVVTFGTPPMKKLPWSSITSGFLRNFLVLPLSCARTPAVAATRRNVETRHSRVIERLL